MFQAYSYQQTFLHCLKSLLGILPPTPGVYRDSCMLEIRLPHPKAPNFDQQFLRVIYTSSEQYCLPPTQFPWLYLPKQRRVQAFQHLPPCGSLPSTITTALTAFDSSLCWSQAPTCRSFLISPLVNQNFYLFTRFYPFFLFIQGHSSSQSPH